MTGLDPFLEYWRAQDALFERVEETWWGAVVSDARYPSIQEPNYARVETTGPVRLAEVERALVPAMQRSGSTRSHVVLLRPQEQVDLVAEASTRGERVTWDLVMAFEGPVPRVDGKAEEVRTFDRAFWLAHAESTRLFDLDDGPAVEQLQAMEREALIPAGRRWFAVREEGRPVALAALLVLQGSGFVDHVVTFPPARRRGYAAALTGRALSEAARAGARRTYLLAEPDGAAERIYLRLGFVRAGFIASWIAPIAR